MRHWLLAALTSTLTACLSTGPIPCEDSSECYRGQACIGGVCGGPDEETLDGAFAGQDGNFAGAPVVNCELSFLPGSIGIDAGNSNAVDLGPADVSGAPRVPRGT